MALELANLERYKRDHGKRKDIQSLAHPLKRPSLEARVMQRVMRLRNRILKTTRIKTAPHDRYIRYRASLYCLLGMKGGELFASPPVMALGNTGRTVCPVIIAPHTTTARP